MNMVTSRQGKTKVKSKQGYGNVKRESRQDQIKVKERSTKDQDKVKAMQDNLIPNNNLMGFDTIEICLVFGCN